MKQSESVEKILPALVKAQSEITNLYPSSKGYGYNYVPLEKIIDMLKEVLPKYGLSWIQLPCTVEKDNCTGLTTRIIHESGEWIEESAVFPLTDMKNVNKSQACGAAITYARRYALCAAFNITGDEDVDCNDKAFSKVEQKPETKTVSEAELIEATTILESYINNKTFEKVRNGYALTANAKEAIKAKDYSRIIKAIDYAKKLESA